MTRNSIETLFDYYYQCKNYYYEITETKEYLVFVMKNNEEIKIILDNN